MTATIGIDPGQAGAIAFLSPSDHLLLATDMPVVDKQVSPQLLRDVIEHCTLVPFVDVVAVVEQVHSMPRQGVSSSFKFGRSYGVVLGVLAGLGIRTVHVTPREWKTHYRLGADKEKARRLAIERWPEHAESFARKKDEGRAEAALIGLWLVETKGGEQ